MSDLRITHWLDLNDFASSSVYQLIDSIVYILSMKKIVVLLSTYNGERFLCAQLDSLLIQEGVELKVLVRDDGSSDSTWDLLIAYKDLLSEEAVWLISRFVFSRKNRHKAQRKAKFYINKCRSASCMQSGWKRTSA